MIAERTFLLAISTLAILGLLTISGCSPHLPPRPVVKESLTVPTNLDEMDEAAELILIAEVEAVDAGAEIEAGPEVVW